MRNYLAQNPTFFYFYPSNKHIYFHKKKSKMKKSFLLLLFPLLFTFCKKEAAEVTMIYQMTQCADAWQSDANYFNNKEATLKAYLEKQGITVLSLTVVQDCSQSAVCAACTCAGCDKATVKVNDIDVAAMEKLKFTKK